MNEKFKLQLFSNPEFGELEFINIDGKPYAAATPIAKALRYVNPEAAIKRHCKGCLKQTVWVQTGIKKDGTPAMRETEKNFIPEGDLFRLIVNSEMPKAQEIELWIFDEVLPSIRVTGSYIPAQLTDNEKFLQIAQNAVELERRVMVTEERQTALETKVNNAVKIFATSDRSWKESMEIAIKELVEARGSALDTRFKGMLYKELEAVAGVDIQDRLIRRCNRMKKQGASSNECKDVTKLDIISYDKKLRPIFEGIIKKYQALYVTEQIELVIDTDKYREEIL